MIYVVSFGMYDWPEARVEIDARWQSLSARLVKAGLDAPAVLVRSNAELPAVPGGIRTGDGSLLAPDPASLDPEDLDLRAVWHHPRLLLAEICHGVLDHEEFPGTELVGQLDYGGIPGCSGTQFASALVCRSRELAALLQATPENLRGLRFAFNAFDSLSGYQSVRDDFAQRSIDIAADCTLVETGSHRASVHAVVSGKADFAAIDARSWQLALQHDAAAATLFVFGWTNQRLGIGLITRRPHAPSVIRLLEIKPSLGYSRISTPLEYSVDASE